MRGLLVLICLFFVGCATLDDVRSVNRNNVLKLSIGMSKEQAVGIMGIKTEKLCPPAVMNVMTWGMSMSECKTVNNPYKSEILQGKEKTFEVLYYYTDIKANDNAITDDELTPLIFDNGKLIGWGWSFLNENIQKYEIRIR